MKILHVTYEAERYGIDTLLLDLIGYQASVQTDLAVGIAFHEDGPCIDRFIELGVTVHRLKLRSAKDVRVLQKLIHIFKNYDIIHLHTYSPWALLAGILTRKKILFMFHGALGFRNRRTDQLKRIYYCIFLNKYCEKITFASQASFKRYTDGVRCSIDDKKVELFPYGRDLSLIQPQGKRAELRKSYSFNNYFIIGTAARLDPMKRLDRLIDAMSNLPVDQKVKLIIAGSGDDQYKKNLIAQSARLGLGDRVEFWGYRSDAIEIISALDLFVLPSQGEPFGLAILEAMVLGIPSATFSDSGGPVDIIGNSGFVVNNPSELSDVIVKISENHAYWEKISEQVKQRAIQFNIDKMADHLLRLYQEMYY